MVRTTAKRSSEESPRPLKSRDLPNISLEQAVLLRLLSAPQLTDWLEEIFQIDVRALPQSSFDGAMLIVGLRCPGGTLSLGIPVDLMPVLSLAVQADAQAEVSFATLVAARLLRPVLERFGEAAKRAGDRRWHAVGISSINFSGVTSGSRHPETGSARLPLAAWEVTLDNHVPARIVLLSIEPFCASALQEMVDGRRAIVHVGMKNWHVRTRLHIASRSCSARLLNSLEVGDVLLAKNASSARQWDGMLYCGSASGRHWTCTVQVKGEKIIMTSELDIHDGRLDDASASSIPLESNVAELEVPVHFEIDSAALSLDQLASLRPGYVINLSLPVDEAEIRLIACGQVVGRGRLVVIGDCLGVQIDHIASGRA